MTTDTTDTVAAMTILSPTPTTETLLAALTAMVSEYADQVHASKIVDSEQDGQPFGTLSIGDSCLKFTIMDGWAVLDGSNESGDRLVGLSASTSDPFRLAETLTAAADFLAKGAALMPTPTTEAAAAATAAEHRVLAAESQRKARTHSMAADLHWADYDRHVLDNPLQGKLDRSLAYAQAAIGDSYCEHARGLIEAAEALDPRLQDQ